MLWNCLRTSLRCLTSSSKGFKVAGAVTRMHQVSMQPPAGTAVAARQQVLAAGLPCPQRRLLSHHQQPVLPSMLQQVCSKATSLGMLTQAQRQLLPPHAAMASVAAGQAGEATTAAAGTSRASIKTRASSNGSSKLQEFLGKPVELEGVVKKINYKGSEDYGILSLQLGDTAWDKWKSVITHKDAQPKAQSQQDRFASAAKKKGRIKHKVVTIKGKGLATLGMHYSVRVRGKWFYNETHGLEVIVDAFGELPSTDPSVIKQKLAHMFKGKGVGPSTVGALVDVFGAEVESVLASSTAVKAMTDKAGVTRSKAQRIKLAYDDATGEENAEQFLAQLGLRKDMISAAASRQGGAEAFKNKLLEDPYLAMMDLPGFTLRLADDVAVKLNFPEDHPTRGPAAMLQALITETSNGHSFLPFTSLVDSTKRTLVKADEDWAVMDMRRKATDTLIESSPSPSPPPNTDTEEELGPAYTRGTTPVLPLKDILYQKADGWAARLMERHKIVMELASQQNQPPTRLHPSQWHAAFNPPASTPASASPRSNGSPSPAAETQSVDDGSSSSRDNDVIDAEKKAAAALPAMQRWPQHSMVYLDPLYQAESKVSEVLARLLGSTPDDVLPPTYPGKQSSGDITAPVTAGMELIMSINDVNSQQPADTAEMVQQVDGADVVAPAGFVPENPGTAERLVWQAKNRLLQEGIELTDKQVEAVRMALFSPVMLLTGAAGCGKTFGTKAIMAVLRAQQKRIMLCAPTGRAAQRLQEAGSDYGLPASTIHRMLGYKPLMRADKLQDETQQGDGAAVASKAETAGPGTAAVVPAGGSKESKDVLNTDILREDLFEFNSTNPLPAHAVLVDEASMLDVQLAAALLRALPPCCQLILIGDPNQLPPVGPGAVLQDMINAGIFPQVHLDTIFRQSSDSSIVAGAHEVIHQRWPTAGLRDPAQQGVDLPVRDSSRRRSRSQSSSANNPGQPGVANSQEAGPAAAAKLMPAYTMPELRARFQQVAEQLSQDSSVQVVPENPSDHALEQDSGEVPPKAPTGKQRKGIQHRAKQQTGTHQHHERLGAVESLWPSDDESDESDSTDVVSHAAIQKLQASLGSDGVVVLEDCEDSEAAQHVVQLVTQLQKAGVRVSSHVQVLSATKETHAGTKNLNRLLQPLMNEKLQPSQRVPSSLHSRQWPKEGDRVVQVENNYEMEVFNGDLGHVLSVTEHQGLRTMKVLFSPRPGETQPHEVKYHDKEMLQIQLAWATTVHKAQGAEYPVVIMVLHDSAARSLQQRKLLYTAITRGRKLLFLVTTTSALHAATRSSSDRPRNTLLATRTLTALQAQGLAATQLALPYPLVALPAANARVSRRASRQYSSPSVTYQPRTQTAVSQTSPPAVAQPEQTPQVPLRRRTRALRVSTSTTRVPSAAPQSAQAPPMPEMPEATPGPQSQSVQQPVQSAQLNQGEQQAAAADSVPVVSGTASSSPQDGMANETLPAMVTAPGGAVETDKPPPPVPTVKRRRNRSSSANNHGTPTQSAGSNGADAQRVVQASDPQQVADSKRQVPEKPPLVLHGVTVTLDTASGEQQPSQAPSQARPQSVVLPPNRRQRRRLS